jgi:CSLREA domain-containing protein
MIKNRVLSLALVVLVPALAEVRGKTFTVNTASDTVVAGVCDTGQSGCSLRGAILAANANSGDDTIAFASFGFCPVGGCSIALQSALPDISTVMSINGPGPGTLTVKPAAGLHIRIFNITVSAAATTTTTISGLTLRDGFVVDDGGGAAINNLSAPLLNVTNCVLIHNRSTANSVGTAQKGAAFASTGGTVNVTGCSFTDNLALNEGGGIYMDNGTMTVANCTFTDNVIGSCSSCGSGGGISYRDGTLTVTGCTFTNNFAGERGGAIFINNSNGLCTVRDSTFTANRAHLGAAIGSFGNLNLSNSTFSGNSTSNNDNVVGSGGAVGIQTRTANITNCTFSGNSAEGSGGGIYNHATLNLTNCTVTGNSVARNNFAPDGGGGVYTVPPDPNNFFDHGGTTNIKSCIVALNSVTSGPGPDASGTFHSAGFNLIGKADTSTGFTAATDRAGTIAAPLDPKLDPNGLQNNGGPTHTIALLLGSPAIDQGTSVALTGNLTSDQRGAGFPRAFDDPSIGNSSGGDGTDIGAFELQSAQPAHLANISTRLRVETGDNVLIGGFIITGTQPKKVIVRAIGPSLPFADKLENPILELRGPAGLIETNDNWVSSANKQAISDTNIAPSDDLESAIVQSLPANNAGYTAIVRGLNNHTGIGVVEAYDLDATVDSKLANVSTRGLVQTSDKVLIAGTIIVGTTSQKIIIRALGPSLKIPGELTDPTLELFDQNGVTIETNDNWVESTNKQAIMDSGIPPADDKESAIVRTLSPSGYTAIVRGVNDTTGIAVVEVYALQ